MSHPAYVVTTKFGQLSLTPTSADHVYATTNPAGGRTDQLLPWTIRGKEHKFITAHVYKHRDGVWRVGGETADTRTGLYADSLSAFAKKVAIPEIEEAVRRLVIARSDVFVDAQKEDLKSRIERLSAKRDEALATFTALVQEIDPLILELDKL